MLFISISAAFASMMGFCLPKLPFSHLNISKSLHFCFFLFQERRKTLQGSGPAFSSLVVAEPTLSVQFPCCHTLMCSLALILSNQSITEQSIPATHVLPCRMPGCCHYRWYHKIYPSLCKSWEDLEEALAAVSSPLVECTVKDRHQGIWKK